MSRSPVCVKGYCLKKLSLILTVAGIGNWMRTASEMLIFVMGFEMLPMMMVMMKGEDASLIHVGVSESS